MAGHLVGGGGGYRVAAAGSCAPRVYANGRAKDVPIPDVLQVVLHTHSLGSSLGAVLDAALPASATVIEKAFANATFPNDGFYDLTSNFATDVDANFSAGKRNIVIAWAGLVEINDFASSAATLKSDADAYVSHAKSFRGGQWEVWLLPIIDCTENDPINTPNLEPTRDAYNTLLFAGAGGSYNVVDLTAVPQLYKTRGYSTSAPRPPGGNAAYDTTYFSDGIHPTAAGRTLVANKIALALA